MLSSSPSTSKDSPHAGGGDTTADTDTATEGGYGDEKEAAVLAASAAVQEFFNRHHDRDGNCDTMSCSWERSEPLPKRQKTKDTAESAQSDDD